MKRRQITFIVIAAIGLGMPSYYKIKFLLLGVITPGDLWHWTLPVELLFSFMLAGLIVAAHDFVAGKLRRWLRKEAYSLRKFIIQYAISTVVAVLTAVVFSLFFWNYVARMPITNEYVFDYAVLGLIIPILVTGASESVFFYGRWEKANVEKEMLRRENIEAKYNVLQNQVNPHFLFNCLNTLGTLIQESKQSAAEFLRDLSSIYRYVLEMRNHDLATIKEELQSLKSYTNLMRHRFGDHFKLNLDISTTGTFLAPLTLQMLMENVFKHNQCSEAFPLEIDVHEDPGYLVFSNKIQAIDQHQPSTGVGLKNLMARYALLSDHQLIVDHGESAFTVKVPLLKPEMA